MSISCVKVEDSVLVKKAEFFGAKEFVLANVDPVTQTQFPFPSDYKFTPCFLPKKYEKWAGRIQHFDIYSDDIWLVTFPKAGTTWILNIVWQLKNNLNFSAEYLNAGYMYFENCVMADVNDENKSNDLYTSYVKYVDGRFDEIDNKASPRIIKSHLPAHLLPRDIWTVKPKLIYLFRDAKDVAISMYHMFRCSRFLEFQGSMEDYFDIFLNDHVTYAPFFAHVNGFRKLKQLDHILLLSYDEMIANPFSGVKQISDFLGCEYTDDQLEQLTQHVSFENMRKRERERQNSNKKFYRGDFNFFRKGKSGGYRDEMSADYIRKFDEWEKQNKD